MKKIISITLALLAVILCPIAVFSAECEHNYLRTPVSATCVEKAHTSYYCRRCGYTYKVYDDEYTTPEGFWLLATSIREEDTLTVTVELFNNPGLTAASPKVGYNANTLAVREFINGDIWADSEYVAGGVNTAKNPFTVFTESEDQANYNNGIYFTVVFDILDPDGSYGITFPLSSGAFSGWNYTTNTLITNTPTLISLVGKSELGDHSYIPSVTDPTCTLDGYTTHTCEYCGDFYTDSTVDALDHSWEFSKNLTEPTFDQEGSDEYLCSSCGETRSVTVPVLEHWAKGDVNNDGMINAVDTNIHKRIIVGTASSLQQYDAADFNDDGIINAIDAYLVKMKVTGV